MTESQPCWQYCRAVVFLFCVLPQSAGTCDTSHSGLRFLVTLLVIPPLLWCSCLHGLLSLILVYRFIPRLVSCAPLIICERLYVRLRFTLLTLSEVPHSLFRLFILFSRLLCVGGYAREYFLILFLTLY